MFLKINQVSCVNSVKVFLNSITLFYPLALIFDVVKNETKLNFTKTDKNEEN